MAQKITPFIWFDGNAEEATKLYTSAFKDSETLRIGHYGDAGPLPKGTVMTVAFRLHNLELVALNGGPEFKFTPAISMFVECETEQEVNSLWAKLSEGGEPLMELGTYPFAERYGWVQDRFGLSWQMMSRGGTSVIRPALLFVGKQYGKAEDAMNFYVSKFEDAKILQLERRDEDDEGGGAGTVKYARFSLSGQEFIAMESDGKHAFEFSLATSFMVNCASQQEVDRFWKELSEGGSEIECGWLTDRYGVAWQVTPSILLDLLHDKDEAKATRVMKAMMKMKKIDIAELLAAAQPVGARTS